MHDTSDSFAPKEWRDQCREALTSYSRLTNQLGQDGIDRIRYVDPVPLLRVVKMTFHRSVVPNDVRDIADCPRRIQRTEYPRPPSLPSQASAIASASRPTSYHTDTCMSHPLNYQ